MRAFGIAFLFVTALVALWVAISGVAVEDRYRRWKARKDNPANEESP